MPTSRLFTYNTGSQFSGTKKYGNLTVQTTRKTDNSEYGGVRWWNGPEEDTGYVIAYARNDLQEPGFRRSAGKTDLAFLNLVNSLPERQGQAPFLSATAAKSWLTANNFWTSWGEIPTGMVLYLDAGISESYPGSGSTWFDLSDNSNDGSLSGATFSSDSGGTMVFDGVNDSITFSNPENIPIGNDPYTISVWFNSDEMPSNRGFVGWGAFGGTNQVNAWRLRDIGVSGFRHYWWGNDLDYTTPMSSGTWYNAIAAYQNGSRKLYLNNVQVAEDFPTGHNVPYATNLRIGVTAESLGEWFDGKIAQVILYKRQATPSEIEAIWNSGKSRFGY
jgi:hypothetical protein